MKQRRLRLTVPALMLTALTAFGAVPHANAAVDERKFEKKDVTAYLYNMENSTMLKCLFYEDMPFEPYVSVLDYLNIIFDAQLSAADNGNGVFTITAPNSQTMVVDTVKDTVHFDLFEKFTSADPADADGDGKEGPYIKEEEIVVEGEAKSFDMSYGKYQIDLTAENGSAYFPLTSISDIFADTYLGAVYQNGNIYFMQTLETPYYDQTDIFSAKPRAKGEIEYTYKELCFVLDHFYGKPRRSEFAQQMTMQGVDTLLSSEDKTGIKQLLLSDSMTDYYTGLVLLDSLLDDGGHTSLSGCYTTALFTDKKTAFAEAVSALADDAANPNAAAIGANLTAIENKKVLANMLLELRNKHYAAYENVKLWEKEKAENNDKFLAQLFMCGDTAVFVFDDFTDEVVAPFKWSLDYAQEKGANNFVIDITQNRGGSANVLSYMMAIMTGNGDYYSTSTLTGNRLRTTGKVDKNLDGVIDEKDDAVRYNFRFALLTTQMSYSCGNYLPCLAQEQGIAVIGETAGGGTCFLANPVYPNAMPYSISGYRTMTDTKGNDVEAGAKPDLETVSVEADGTIDYNKLYDITAVSAYLAQQPAKQNTARQATTDTVKAANGLPIGIILLMVIPVVLIIAVVIIILAKKRKNNHIQNTEE